ncbi:hypothetical protein QAD02_017722 [Eretmocerus hayati]|uniref:Uncharacterized protein n=1 Tax=Eretmocerus hayati TaxID=131215 RepID=A0ACC2PJI7_9HYME|nr:hypothetical protein QAD02_017722 [Eretmocerus hayati]
MCVGEPYCSGLWDTNIYWNTENLWNQRENAIAEMYYSREVRKRNCWLLRSKFGCSRILHASCELLLTRYRYMYIDRGGAYWPVLYDAIGGICTLLFYWCIDSIRNDDDNNERQRRNVY